MAYTPPDPSKAREGGPRPRAEDPRSIITPDAFHVEPSLLGAPLASPSRRLAAMLIDLVLLGFVVNAPGWLFALITAFVLFRATSRKSGSKGGAGRVLLRAGGAVVAFVGVLSLVSAISGLFSRDERPAAGPDPGPQAEAAAPPEPGRQGEAAMPPEPGQVEAAVPPEPGRQGVAEAPLEPAGGGEGADEAEAGTDAAVPTPGGVLREMIALGRASSADEARPHAAAAARFFAAQGDRMDDPGELRESLEDLADLPLLSMNDEVFDVVEEEFRRAGVLPAANGEAGEGRLAAVDSLLRARDAAFAAGDTGAAEAAGREAGALLAADSVGRLAGQVRTLRRDVASQRERADEAERAAERTPIGLVMDLLADEIGVSAGWAALYFTAMLALWRGRTPGKRALGIRVIRLDGKPLGWFASFERFGGYAAALATGTLGFFQILWDRNRQGVHDKISETVVIRDIAPEHVVRRRVTTR